MSKHTLIKNATLVNEGETRQADVRIEGAYIEEIGTDLATTETCEVIDAQGLILLPGMIDDQVHFREPGLTHKGDLHTESRAAVAGGITSTMEMPNTSPPTTNADAIRDKLARARDRSYTNYAFYLGATNDNLEDVRSIDPTLVCGTKVFMGASTGNMLVDDPDILEKIFAHCPTLIATHCEDTPMIAANTVKMQQQYGDDIPARLHPLIRSREACLKSSTMAVKLARENHARLHVLHLTTGRGNGPF